MLHSSFYGKGITFDITYILHGISTMIMCSGVPRRKEETTTMHGLLTELRTEQFRFRVRDGGSHFAPYMRKRNPILTF